MSEWLKFACVRNSLLAKTFLFLKERIT